MTTIDWQEPTGWPEDARRDRLIGDWHMYQRTGGHRTSTDDLITAWYAAHRSRQQGQGRGQQTQQRPQRYLDLGCGIGSVLLMVCHRLRPVIADGVEAQAQSVAMARRSIAELPQHDVDIRVHHSDFRDLHLDGDGGDRGDGGVEQASYDVVTGSPPYFPLNAGVLPNDPQRRACRFEARGGVEVYLRAASQALAPRGRCYIVFQTRWSDRVDAAADECGLALTGRADFLMRRDRPEHFLTVFEFMREAADKVHRFSCPVRESNGEITAEYTALRRELGLS